MTVTSEEEESEKGRDKDEMNGYDEETMRDGMDKSWEGLEKGSAEGNMEEEERETERSEESSKSRKRKAKRQKQSKDV